MMILKDNSDITDAICVGMCQVHGSNVVTVSSKNAGTVIQDCDGLITNDSNIFLKISVADCIPMAIFDPAGKCVALVHAGWRGLYGRIIFNAVDLMCKNFGTNPADVMVEIGPHICQKHYEIKEDLAEKFSDYGGAITENGQKRFLDLGKVAVTQLKKMGVKIQNIEISKRCTFEDTALSSYRRGDLKKRVHYILKIPESP